MSTKMIGEHFVKFLGEDVGVSFSDPKNSLVVTLYHPDKLPETFVQWAFEELEKVAPEAAAGIDRVVVSYETRLGRTQRGVTLSRVNHLSNSELNSEWMEQDPTSTDLSTFGQTKRFYPAACTVCGDPALEAFVTAQELEIECGRCGGYGMTIEDKARIGRLPQRERKAWLDNIRQSTSANSGTVPINRSNDLEGKFEARPAWRETSTSLDHPV
jgi:hypothetical protein